MGKNGRRTLLSEVAEIFTRIAETAASVGLVAICLMLYRFFRGGIMETSFAVFSLAGSLFLGGTIIATLMSFGFLSDIPFDEIHLLLEICFVLLLLLGFVLLYHKWMLQHKVPEESSWRDINA